MSVSTRVRRIGRRLKARLVPCAVVLMYHRVANLGSDPQLLAVTPDHFDEHLMVLRREARPLSLHELTASLRAERLPRKAVAVTFDDGYADNLENARPLLARHDVPATVFVTSGQVGSDEEFWWDELERLLLQPGTLPELATLTVNGCSDRWDLADARFYSAQDAHHHHAWHVESSDDPTPRHRLYRALYEIVHPLSVDERQRVLRQVRSWTDTPPSGRLTHRALTCAEVARLGVNELVDIGAHTVTHVDLSGLPHSGQYAEISRSKAQLEDLVGRRIEHFAYPYGRYTQATRDIVRDLGFAAACTSDPAIVWRRTDQYQLPRMVIRNWDGDEFERRLRRWFGG